MNIGVQNINLSFLILIQVGTYEEAQRAIDLGADAIIVQGFEAGGHHLGLVCIALLSIINYMNITPSVFIYKILLRNFGDFNF